MNRPSPSPVRRANCSERATPASTTTSSTSAAEPSIASSQTAASLTPDTMSATRAITGMISFAAFENRPVSKIPTLAASGSMP